MGKVSKLAEMIPNGKPSVTPDPNNPGQMHINIEELQKHNLFFCNSMLWWTANRSVFLINV